MMAVNVSATFATKMRHWLAADISDAIAFLLCSKSSRGNTSVTDVSLEADDWRCDAFAAY